MAGESLWPVVYTDRSKLLSNLATQLSSHFEHWGNDKDLDQAITLHREALALHLDFPRTLAMDAASCALRSGDMCRTVELWEQGRTIIWTQMTRLRTPLDSLWTCGNHAVALVKKFRNLNSLLNKPPANNLEVTPRVDAEAEGAWYRHLVNDWNGAVEEIWKIEGFSRFLLPPLFSDLRDAARDGLIIVLIASKLSFHAIIILHKQPPTSIQLLTNFEKLQAFQTLVVKLKRESKEALKKVFIQL
ncbi:hypothetical protein DFJ58DRAFT_844301 [Suillus subalutaceus]|uniref:uncharacterized protein n=1 Tax=Suillus subalutaceus TaxID=48586 RepID=UPI001B87EB78|nr:uncharacterized protein DFJ58DRAFT_844301 [Suillus subalutaceus]KAG1843448.1 hypothetical protein DFJ58DRAFT_844301 [Suillus subalutaceus]